MSNDASLRDRIAEREAAVAAFVHPADAVDDAGGHLVGQLASVLTPVFLFIAKGRLGKTMDLRAWVVLHETRLDLIGHESIDDFAARRGVSSQRVKALVKEFRCAVPGYRSPVQISDAHARKLSEVHKARVADRQKLPIPLPPGRKSPSEGAQDAGSATP